MTDRDTFAAAALTGLLANEGDGPSLSGTCKYAYRIADAMLAVRDSRTAKTTTHNAATPPQGGVPDSENWNKPVAWAVVYPNDEVAVIAFRRRDADERASASDRIVPLYRHPSPTLTDAEREAVEWAVSAAENVMHPADSTLRRLLDRLA